MRAPLRLSTLRIAFIFSMNSKKIDNTDQDYLERLVALEEIKEAVWDCGSSKAPGPDGFSFAFVKKYWDIIQKDLHDFINSFFASSELPYGANSSFFTLIPKFNNPTLITNFHPISLIGIHYKIIAKILANWLSKVIDKIVRKEQSAFIAGSSILVNGIPTSEFSINRGFRQGDPLSPFLFILVMKGLHNAFAEAVGNGLISGININNSTINISHLFFVDDVIITTNWNARDLENIIHVLHVFYHASGFKINIHKSNIYGIGVNEEEVSNMASNAGCIVGNIPFNYLGLPIGSNMKSIASWKMLVDRFHLRLSTWKANLLSIGGRLTLIKMLSSPNDLWVKVVKAFHGHEGGFDNNGCSFKGYGTHIRFWKDIWVGEAPLFTRYNRLYRLDQDKDCLIIDRINNGQWLNLSLRGMDILAISCSSCNANVESANHIFFECIITTEMWKLLYRWCEFPFVQALSLEAFKDWFISWHASKEKKRRLYVISTSVLWWLWRY
ncbi:RNA-directed DNA polymerase, eukaryota, reverse transcriptase zinc-binding domain protein [Tanacetum coccineum]